MDAINLIYRYNEGRIDIEQTGIFTCIDMEDVNNPQKFADWMFGTGVVVKGGLKLGSTYIYAYTDGKETPDGFTADDNPAMVLLSPYGDSIFIYEIEDL